MIAPGEDFGGRILDTGNLFLVGVNGDRIIIVRTPRGPLNTDEAVNLAAWLVCLADPKRDKFDRLVREILK